jgi:hypothetical protein
MTRFQPRRDDYHQLPFYLGLTSSKSRFNESYTEDDCRVGVGMVMPKVSSDSEWRLRVEPKTGPKLELVVPETGLNGPVDTSESLNLLLFSVLPLK